MLENYRDLAFFHDFTPDELNLLEPLFKTCAFKTGDVIFEQGEPAGTFYLLLSGSVAILFKPYDGPEITITHLTGNGAFGWSALVGSEVYTSSTISKTDCQTICISGADLRELCLSHPGIGQSILDRLASMVSTRWTNAQQQVRDMIRSRVASQNSNATRGGTSMGSYSSEDQIKGLLEQVSAYVEQYHGGSVEFVSLQGKVLKVRLGGACLGCPLSPATLHGWVAGTVRQFFPELEVVAAE
ncbi:MAG: cyclic nucleotide-binding domain-containing protein [Chloroflexota bacterium]